MNGNFLIEDRSAYHDAQLVARGRWPEFLSGFLARFATNQEPNHAPPSWWATAGRESLLGEYINIPAAYLNSPQTQNIRSLKPIGPYDLTTAQSSALQAALAASLRAAQTGQTGRGG